MPTVQINGVEYQLDTDDKTGAPRWHERRVDPPQQPSPNASEESGLPPTDLLDKFVVAHWDSFDEGFGESTYVAGDRSYGASSGAYMLDKMRVGPANKIYHVGFGIADPGAEEASAPHTTSNATITATLSVANSYEGEYHWAFTTSVNDGVAYWTIANPTVLQSKSLTFRAMGRMSATATGEAVRVFVWDDVTGYTYSSAVAGTTWTAMTATATINAAAATVRVGIADNGTMIDTETARVDACGIASAGTDTPVGFAQLSTSWYTAAGRFVYEWDETNDKFDIVKVLDANATAIETWGVNVFVAVGSGNKFVYGSDTTWTDSNRSGTDDEADYFARGTDTDGNDVLWRGLRPNTVSITSDPLNGGTAWTNYTVGEADSHLTGVYWWNRTVLVGKRDGLYVFQSTYFANITSEKKVAASSDNFSAGQEFFGSLWLSSSRGALYRWSLGLLQGPLAEWKMEGFEHGPGGQVGAIGTDGTSLLVGMNARTSSDRAWILQTNSGKWIHTLYEFAAPDDGTWLPSGTNSDTHFEEMRTIDAIGTFSNYVYVAGTTTTGVTRIEVGRWAAPTTSETPYRDTSPDPQAKFYIRLPRVGIPTEKVSFADVIIGSRNLTTTNRVANVYYRADNGAITSLGAADTSPSQTLTFTNVNANELELFVECASTTGATSPIELLPITIRGTMRPTRKRIYIALVKIGTLLAREGGALDYITGAAQYTNLRAAETSNNPVTHVFADDFNADSNSTTSVTVHVKDVRLDRLVPNQEGGWTRVYQVSMVEA